MKTTLDVSALGDALVDLLATKKALRKAEAKRDHYFYSHCQYEQEAVERAEARLSDAFVAAVRGALAIAVNPED